MIDEDQSLQPRGLWGRRGRGGRRCVGGTWRRCGRRGAAEYAQPIGGTRAIVGWIIELYPHKVSPILGHLLYHLRTHPGGMVIILGQERPSTVIKADHGVGFRAIVKGFNRIGCTTCSAKGEPVSVAGRADIALVDGAVCRNRTGGRLIVVRLSTIRITAGRPHLEIISGGWASDSRIEIFGAQEIVTTARGRPDQARPFARAVVVVTGQSFRRGGEETEFGIGRRAQVEGLHSIGNAGGRRELGPIFIAGWADIVRLDGTIDRQRFGLILVIVRFQTIFGAAAPHLGHRDGIGGGWAIAGGIGVTCLQIDEAAG